LRYAGYWYDSELEWYWLTTRYYNSEDLRFLQPDPSDQDGVHTYAYVGDDPVDAADPSGLKDFPSCAVSPTIYAWLCRKLTGDPNKDPLYRFVMETISDPDNQQLFFMVLTDGLFAAAEGGLTSPSREGETPPKVLRTPKTLRLPPG